MLGAGFIKFHQVFQKSLVMGGWGGGKGDGGENRVSVRGELQLCLLFCKIMCHG